MSVKLCNVGEHRNCVPKLLCGLKTGVAKRRKHFCGEMNISLLPAECVSHIVSFTSPRDACRSSAVSSLFQIAADSDFVWEKFLPRDIKEIISNSSFSSTLNSLSRKDLYFRLCNHPITIGDGNKSFALEKQSGKKCYMVGARGLSVIWGDTPRYWQWISLPESRFSQVAELKHVWWLEIKGSIETKNLSPGTTYAAYFVYQLLSRYKQGFVGTPVTLSIVNEPSAVAVERSMVLDPTPPQARNRGDGWLEIEMGEFVAEEENATVVCSLMETRNYKSGLVVEGIELRPKDV